MHNLDYTLIRLKIKITAYKSSSPNELVVNLLEWVPVKPHTNQAGVLVNHEAKRERRCEAE